MSVSINVEMRGDLSRPNRNVAEEICKAIERIVEKHGGIISVTEHRISHRSFLSDEAYTPEHTEKINLVGSYHAEDQ